MLRGDSIVWAFGLCLIGGAKRISRSRTIHRGGERWQMTQSTNTGNIRPGGIRTCLRRRYRPRISRRGQGPASPARGFVDVVRLLRDADCNFNNTSTNEGIQGADGDSFEVGPLPFWLDLRRRTSAAVFSLRRLTWADSSSSSSSVQVCRFQAPTLTSRRAGSAVSCERRTSCRARLVK